MVAIMVIYVQLFQPVGDELLSFNRENVIWQSADGSWNRGFFAVANQFGDDEEWDVEYDYSKFSSVYTNLFSEEDAASCSNEPNPGGYSVIRDEAYVEKYDRMALFCVNPEAKAKFEENERQRKLEIHKTITLPELFKDINPSWDNVRVTVVENACLAYTLMSEFGQPQSYRTYSGSLTRAGDWYTINGINVYNNDTGEFASNINSVRKDVRPMGNRFSSVW